MSFDLTWFQYLLLGLAALAAGLVNALAGGGTLITFPALIAMGVSPVVSNITNTMALLPGHLGSVLAQKEQLKQQKKQAIIYAIAGLIGGLAGGYLLLHTGEKLFKALVPYLILIATLLLAVADPVRRWVGRKTQASQPAAQQFAWWSVIPVIFAAAYGGYFGAGLGVIVIAVLGLVSAEKLTKLNALKVFIALTTNLAAAVYFLFSDKVLWSAALVMAVFALIGGALGGRLSQKIKPGLLRWIIVVLGLIMTVYYFTN